MSVVSLSRSSFIAIVVLLSASTSPLFASAYYACPSFSGPLHIGMSDARTGGAVSELQRFLATDEDVYPEGEVTGYFGMRTERAVQRFQERYGIVSSGSAFSTGYGSVGPTTQRFITASCGTSMTGNTTLSSGETIQDIDTITVSVDEYSDTAEVVVEMDSSEEYTFDIENGKRTAMINSIGDTLSDEYGFDFDTFSTERKRDAKIKKLVRFEDVTTTEGATIAEIKDITVVTQSGARYAQVEVDMRRGDDIEFDVTAESQADMIESIADKLERSYDFDFSEFSSDSDRDEEIASETSFTTIGTAPTTCTPAQLGTQACPSFKIYDIKSVTHVVKVVSSVSEKTYTITLKNDVKKTVKLSTANTPSQIQAAIDATGFIGSVESLLALSTTVTPSPATPTVPTYVLSAVTSIIKTEFDPNASSVDDEYTVYAIRLLNGKSYSVRGVSGRGTTERYEKPFRDTGYVGSVSALVALAKPSVAAYMLTNVKAVTQSSVKSGTDFVITYKVRLADNSIRTVVAKKSMTTVQRDAAFKKSGYTGDVTKLIEKIAESETDTFTIADVKTVTRTLVAPQNADVYYVYTVTLYSGKKFTVNHVITQTRSLERGLNFYGYRGDVSLIMNKAL